jgi:hypothetical protein
MLENAVPPRSDHWTCKRRVDFLVELANDVGGRVLGRREAERPGSLVRSRPLSVTSSSASERVAGLRGLGWAEGRNLTIDYGWPVDDIKRMQTDARPEEFSAFVKRNQKWRNVVRAANISLE